MVFHAQRLCAVLCIPEKPQGGDHDSVAGFALNRFKLSLFGLKHIFYYGSSWDIKSWTSFSNGSIFGPPSFLGCLVLKSEVCDEEKHHHLSLVCLLFDPRLHPWEGLWYDGGGMAHTAGAEFLVAGLGASLYGECLADALLVFELLGNWREEGHWWFNHDLFIVFTMLYRKVPCHQGTDGTSF